MDSWWDDIQLLYIVLALTSLKMDTISVMNRNYEIQFEQN